MRLASYLLYKDVCPQALSVLGGSCNQPVTGLYKCAYLEKLCDRRASLMAQTGKNLPTVQETQVRSPGWEDPLEKETATHSRTLAWIIPWTEEHCRLQSMGSQRVGHD